MQFKTSNNSKAKSNNIIVTLFCCFWVFFIYQVFQWENPHVLDAQSTTLKNFEGELSSFEMNKKDFAAVEKPKQSTTFKNVEGELSSFEKNMAEFAAVEKPKNTDSPGTNAIVYVGPRKTGSTSIQDMAMLMKPILEEENYEVIINYNISQCFRYKSDCDPDEWVFKKKENVLIATEDLTVDNIDYIKFKMYLDHWDNVTIVYHYRRFHDWCQSWLSQESKMSLIWGSHPLSIKEKIEEKEWRATQYHRMTNWAKEYKAHFDNVIIKNMHDKKTNFILSLFCNDIPNAPKTCKAAQEMGVVKSNEGAIPYLQVGFYAFDEHLIEGDPSELGESFLDLGSNISNAHLKINNGNMDDFTFDCPSSSVLDDFLKESLKLEKEMFPEFFASPLGEDALRENFKEVSKAKLCDVNKTTLQNPVWKQVFKELNN